MKHRIPLEIIYSFKKLSFLSYSYHYNFEFIDRRKFVSKGEQIL